jgi:hypothetical protein
MSIAARSGRCRSGKRIDHQPVLDRKTLLAEQNRRGK